MRLFYVNGNFLVYEPEVAITLREKHHIVGTLIGFAHTSLQSDQETIGVVSLPMQLLPEQAWLLIEKGLVKVFNEGEIYEQPTEEQVNQLKETTLREAKKKYLEKQENERQKRQKFMATEAAQKKTQERKQKKRRKEKRKTRGERKGKEI